MNDYLEPLIIEMRASANSAEATKMAKYMRNQFDFLGIKSPQRRKILKDFLNRYGRPSLEILDQIAEELWQLPQREFQYCALDILAKLRQLPADKITLVEKLIVQKSWWDTVDLLASNVVGKLFSSYPELKDEYLPKWLDSNNFWLQRTCLIFQLHYKQKTDVELLFQIINKLQNSDEFFLNKAIGWALRQHSKVDAEVVVKFVEANQLSKLSKREGLKWLQKKGKID